MRDPARVRVAGPLAPYATDFLVGLIAVGYRRASAALQLRLMAHLSRWLGERGLVPAQLPSMEAERFLAARRAAGYRDHCSPKALEPLLGYLRQLSVVPPAEPPVLSAAELLLERYRGYLIVERGLAAHCARLCRSRAPVRCRARGREW